MRRSRSRTVGDRATVSGPSPPPPTAPARMARLTPGRGPEVITVARRRGSVERRRPRPVCATRARRRSRRRVTIRRETNRRDCPPAVRRPPDRVAVVFAPSDATDPAAIKAAKVAASLGDVDLVGQVLVPELYGENATKVTSAAAKANESDGRRLPPRPRSSPNSGSAASSWPTGRPPTRPRPRTRRRTSRPRPRSVRSTPVCRARRRSCRTERHC